MFSELHTVSSTLGNRPLAATASHTDTVDNIALLGLVAELAGLMGTSGAGAADDGLTLTVFPAADTENESHDVRLLLPPQLVNVLESTYSYLRSRTISDGDTVIENTQRQKLNDNAEPKSSQQFWY